MINKQYNRYVSSFAEILNSAQATDAKENSLTLDASIEHINNAMMKCHDQGRRIMLVGNGGSASVCSHMAIDFSNNGGMRAVTFNEGSALTCLGNDYGYQNVFSKQIEWQACEGDILVAISSSGQSENILNAVRAGRNNKCTVFTFSGFMSSNPLRKMGDLNIYLPSSEYGFVEVGHLAILHACLDIKNGWVGAE